MEDLNFKYILKDDTPKAKESNNFTTEFNKVFPKFLFVGKGNEIDELKNIEIYLAKLEKVTVLQKLMILWYILNRLNIMFLGVYLLTALTLTS